MRLLASIKDRVESVTGWSMHRGCPHGLRLDADLARLVPGLDIETIFDVGANEGWSALYFARRHPRATVHSFEPVGATFERLSAAIRGHARIRAHHLALGARAGEVRVVLGESSVTNRVSEERNDGESVRLTTIDDFARDNGIGRIGYVKIDTEGYDLEVLRGARGLLGEGRIDVVQAELGMNPENLHHVGLDAVRTHLEGLGYRIFGFYDQRHEWPTNRPHLRRADVVFLGPAWVRGEGA